jgi:hypothetical protein
MCTILVLIIKAHNYFIAQVILRNDTQMRTPKYLYLIFYSGLVHESAVEKPRTQYRYYVSLPESRWRVTNADFGKFRLKLYRTTCTYGMDTVYSTTLSD